MNTLPFATAKYSVVHILYWTSYCMTICFASVFLLEKNFSNSEIGLVLAAVNILAVILQPAMAAFIDNTKKISIKNFICIMLLFVSFLSVCILISSDMKPLLVIFMIIAFCILAAIHPLINSICFKYGTAGIKINYGVARGLGSGAYAFTSIILGNIIAKHGSKFLPVYYIAVFIILILVMYRFTPNKTPESIKTSEASGLASENTVTPLSFQNFIKKYSVFMIFVSGSSLVFFPHFLINNFTIQIMYSIGGSSAEMGTATFIAAMMELPVMFAFVKLKSRISCTNLLKISAIVFTIKHILAYLSSSVPMFYATQLLQIAAYGLFIPASVYYVEQIIQKEDSVKGQAMVTGAMTLGSILASIIGGILLDKFNAETMMLAGVISSFAGTLVMLCSLRCQRKSSARQS